MGPSDGFSQDHGDVNDLNLGAVLHLVLLWNCVSHHHGLKCSTVNSGNGWAREDAMGEDGIHSGGPR